MPGPAKDPARKLLMGAYAKDSTLAPGQSWEQPGAGFRWAPQDLNAAVPALRNEDLPGHLQAYAPPPVRPARSFARAAVESGLDAAALPVKAASRAADYLTGKRSTFSDISGKDAAESLEWLANRKDPQEIRREETFAEGEVPQARAAGQLFGEYVGGAPLAALTGRVPAFNPILRAASGGASKKHPEAVKSMQTRAQRAYRIADEDPSDPWVRERIEQLGQAQSFLEENPAFSEKAESAARFFDQNPQAKAPISRLTDGSAFLNKYLRNRAAGGRIERDVNARAAQTQQALTAAAREGHTYDGEVFRGVNLPREQLDSWLANGYVRNASFLSTSADPKVGVASSVSSPGINKDNPAVLMRMRGSGVPIAGVSQYPHEQEVLMRRGMLWKIAGHSVDDDGRTVLDMVEVPRAPAGVTPGLAIVGGRLGGGQAGSPLPSLEEEEAAR